MTAAAVVGLAVCAVLAVGCVVADKLFPRIHNLERYIDRLPLGGSHGNLE